MEICYEKMGKSLVIELKGNLDTTTAPELKEVLKNEMAGVQELVFHLEALKYMSSAGLAVFTIAIKQMEQKNGVIMVCGANESVLKGFKMTGLSRYLNFQNLESTKENGEKEK